MNCLGAQARDEDLAPVGDRDLLARTRSDGLACAKAEFHLAGDEGWVGAIEDQISPAATAIDRFGNDAVRHGAEGDDRAVVDDLDLAAEAAGAAGAANRQEARDRTLHHVQPRQADRQPVAATTADGLRQNAVSAFAKGADLAVVDDQHIARIIARTATATDIEARVTDPQPARRRGNDHQRTIAATACDRLRDNAVGIIAPRDNRSDVSRRDQVEDGDITGNAAHATRAADIHAQLQALQVAEPAECLHHAGITAAAAD